MREILFRGKRKDNGEWVFGMPWIFKDHACVCPWHEGMCKYDSGYYPVHVDPATIGQYTGLVDKNGNKIFEGDIVEGHCHSQWSHRLQRCVVVYERDGFEARHYVMQGGEKRYYTYKVLFSKDVVVIGNIHDNPELIGGKEDGKAD